MPSPAPLTDMLPPPELGWLGAVTAELTLASYDAASVALPTRPPDVTLSRKLPCEPPSMMPTSAESDAHMVASAPDPPSRLAALYPADPKPDPLTDMVLAPRLGWLGATALELPRPSYDAASLTLPTRLPDVMPRRSVACDPLTTMPATRVSDAHSVIRAAVPPSRPQALYQLMPKPDPLTDTLPPPELGWLGAVTLVPPSPSYDAASVTVPTRLPDVTRSRKLPCTPADTMPATDESDAHAVA